MPIVWLILLTAAIALAACSPFNAQQPSPTSTPPVLVDSTFREFYDRLGGFETLGPPISDMREVNQYRVQFTVASLMVYDPRALPGERFFLAPLGLEFDVAEPAISSPSDFGDRYVNGHQIHESFWDLYTRLGGSSGPPITDARYNPEKHRLEQYFTSLGFYIPEEDPSRTVHLMAYGAYKCDRYCRYPSQPNAIPSMQKVLIEPFASAVLRLGLEFTGRPLTDPFLASDGNQEVIFDNIVLATNPQNPSLVFPRPIVSDLDIQPQPLTTRNNDDRLNFYPIDGDLGHNIPVVFTDYLARHGTLKTAGTPISEILLFDDVEGIYRQCFTNLCLDYYQFPVPGEPSIRPAPLGLNYKSRYYDQALAEESSAPPSTSSVTILISEKAALIAADESQRISVTIFNGDAPISGIVPDLNVHLPDGTERLYFLPATSTDGLTSYTLPPIDALNGTLIPYEVCIQNIDNQRSCENDEFIIWGK